MKPWMYKSTLVLSISAALMGCGGGGSGSSGSGDSSAGNNVITSYQCTNTNSLSVLSIKNDGTYTEPYQPSNVIDGNLSVDSRWQSEGENQSLILDVGSDSYVNQVSILWYQEENMPREYQFEIMSSNDGETWKPAIITEQSESSIVSFTNYTIETAQVRYVKIVGQENNVDNLNSIIEVKVKGCGQLFDLDPMLPPSSNFDLSRWYLGVPVDIDNNGKSDSIYEKELNNGYALEDTFYTNENDGGMVFRVGVNGPKTSENTSYTRTELREMIRQGDTSIKTQGVNKNNWVFSSAPASEQDKAGGVDGVLEATLAVNHVTTDGDDYQIGRVIIGQIHANDDEPIRLYYRKLPNNTKGSIYFAHESRHSSNDEWHVLIGSKSDSADNPSNGIALDEKFSYRIEVVGNKLTVTISRVGQNDVSKTINMSGSGYDEAGQYMYFKAGVYNQNNTSFNSDYVQATFYALSTQHN